VSSIRFDYRKRLRGISRERVTTRFDGCAAAESIRADLRDYAPAERGGSSLAPLNVMDSAARAIATVWLNAGCGNGGIAPPTPTPAVADNMQHFNLAGNDDCKVTQRRRKIDVSHTGTGHADVTAICHARLNAVCSVADQMHGTVGWRRATSCKRCR